VTPLYAVFAKLFFFANLFSSTDFLFPPKNKLSSQRVLQLPPYKASPIRTSTCTTSYQPVEFTSFCLVFAMLFLRRQKELPSGHHLGSQLPQRPTGGLLVSWGCWYLPGGKPGGVKMTCNNFFQNRPKNRNSTQSDRPTLCFFVFFSRGPLADSLLITNSPDIFLWCF
jgi:hypothetical protein